MLLVLCDAVFTAVAMLAAVILRLGRVEGVEYFRLHWTAVLIAWFFFGVSYYVSGLYDTEGLGINYRFRVISFVAWKSINRLCAV